MDIWCGLIIQPNQRRAGQKYAIIIMEAIGSSTNMAVPCFNHFTLMSLYTINNEGFCTQNTAYVYVCIAPRIPCDVT